MRGRLTARVAYPKSRATLWPRFPASTSSSLVLADPLPLDSGQALERRDGGLTKTYGELAAGQGERDPGLHALTGDQHLASPHPITGKPGWWSRMVGPGKPIDTDRFHVICANVIGRLHGLDRTREPGSGQRALRNALPVITIRDMVRAQVALLDALGIGQLHAWSAARWAGCRR
jgi:homoserine O-acetyltransferase